MTENKKTDLGEDMLKGADAIAEFLFGEANGRRRIYYLVKHTKLPVFRIGATLCARRSVLVDYIATQEKRFTTR